MNPLDNLECITLLTEDLERSRAFYRSVFAARPIFEDDVSTVLDLNGVMLNLLCFDQADELLAPRQFGQANARPRAMFTVRVEDVDRTCEELSRAGVVFLNGPLDRPWGRRTAAFLDPSGHAWEIAQELSSS